MSVAILFWSIGHRLFFYKLHITDSKIDGSLEYDIATLIVVFSTLVLCHSAPSLHRTVQSADRTLNSQSINHYGVQETYSYWTQSTLQTQTTGGSRNY